jgi:aminoglycoside phosphotransferase (APT) family kinase protein
MRQISESGFGPEAEFSIPEPFAYMPELQLLLQDKVDGPLATEIFLTGNESERARAAERCARWLAHFHEQAPLSGPVFVLTHKAMEYSADRLAKPVGSLADKARLLLKRLENAASALESTEICACHGGYCHHQIISTETRTSTFDWDNYCVADPTWDVARFIVNLQKLALKSLDSLKALDAVGEAFYKTYTATSRFEVAKHLPFYKAAHCLKRARHRLEPMLDEGLRILAEEM